MLHCSINLCVGEKSKGRGEAMHISLPLKIDQKTTQKKKPHNNEINQDNTTGGLQTNFLNVIFSQATQISNFLFLPEAIKARTLSLASKTIFLASSCIYLFIYFPCPLLCQLYPCIYHSTGAPRSEALAEMKGVRGCSLSPLQELSGKSRECRIGWGPFCWQAPPLISQLSVNGFSGWLTKNA